MFRRPTSQTPNPPSEDSQATPEHPSQPGTPLEDYGVRSLGSIASGWNGLDSSLLGQSTSGNPGLGMDLTPLKEDQEDQGVAGERMPREISLDRSLDDVSAILMEVEGNDNVGSGGDDDGRSDSVVTPLQPLSFATLAQSAFTDDPFSTRGRPPQSSLSSPMSMHSIPTSLMSGSISSFSHSRTVSPAESSDAQPAHPLPTRSYVFSRTHWAVEEARRRTQEQGDDMSLVLPTLKLPSSSLLVDQPDRDPDIQTSSHLTATPRSPTAARPLQIILCGTNRTVNAFLRSLLQEGRLRLFRLKEKGRSKEGGGFDVGVFLREEVPTEEQMGSRVVDGALRFNTGEASGVASPANDFASPALPYLRVPEGEEEKTLVPKLDSMVAKITVYGKGQDGNLSKAIVDIEASYKRLNELLNPYPPIEPLEVKQDLHDLVDLWIDKVAATSKSAKERNVWYDLGILTGDARFLAGRDRELLNRFTSMIPTLCFPDSLAERLQPYLYTQFFSFPGDQTPSNESPMGDETSSSSKLGDPTPTCEKSSSKATCYFETAEATSTRSAAVALADMLASTSGVDCNIRHEKVESFLRWKTSANVTSLESSHHSHSTAPVPTIARRQAVSDWEANLSRRHAARSHGKATHRSSDSLGAALERQTTAPPNFFGDGAWRSGQAQPRSTSWVTRVVLQPLRVLRGSVFSGSSESGEEEKSTGRGWLWAAIACVTFVAGIECYFVLSTR